MKKLNTRTKLWSLAVLLVGMAAFSFSLHAAAPRTDKIGPSTVVIKTADGSRFLFNVELAITEEQQKTGLMSRTAMQDNAGMLFLFEDLGRHAFWMKDTLIPLDMLFLENDGTILHIHHMARPQDESRITAQEPFRAVLELNGGLADKLGIHEGDKVLNPAFRNELVQ